jgi:hypothetical protein
MRLVETITEGEYGEYGEDFNLKVILETSDFEGSVSFGTGEPEDMTLSADLSDAYRISKLIKAAYDAGVRGEVYSFEQITEEQKEDD